MENCLSCTCVIEKSGQYYNTSDLGPELVYALQQNLNNEVENDELICSECFVNLLVQLSASATQKTNSNICVWCRKSVFARRAQTVPHEGPIRDLISKNLFREIPANAMLCHACWVRARVTVQKQGNVCPPADDFKCVWCERSLTRTRRCSIPEGPERDEIAREIFPREIPQGGLICYACWMSARRSVQRSNRQQNGQEIVPYTCAWCEISIHRRQRHCLPNGPEREEVAARIHPRELPERAMLCISCWTQARQNIDSIGSNLVKPNPMILHQSVTLDDFAHSTHSSNHCFVPSCKNPERKTMPDYKRKLILMNHKIFICSNARVCDEHKALNNWDFLDQEHFSKTFNKNEIESMLRLSLQDSG